MENEFANLNLTDDEDDVLEGESITKGEEDEFEFYLVGRVLTESVVHFPSMRSTMVKVWHPVGDISITNLREQRTLFRFYHEIDK